MATLRDTRPYRKFAAALRVAISSRGYKQVDVAREVGVHKTTISRFCLGQHLPQPQLLASMVELLDAPHLATIIREATGQRKCLECEVMFVPRTMTQRFCRPSHQRTHNWRRTAEARIDAKSRQLVSYARTVAELQRRLGKLAADHNEILAAVARYCWECEPEGVCRDSTSALREWSPLPLADERLRIA